MKQVIWKFPLALESAVQSIEMPEGAAIIKVAWQDCPCLWALCEPDNSKETRKFFILATGQPFEGDYTMFHHGSVLQNGGQFVWHVFEDRP